MFELSRLKPVCSSAEAKTCQELQDKTRRSLTMDVLCCITCVTTGAGAISVYRGHTGIDILELFDNLYVKLFNMIRNI